MKKLLKAIFIILLSFTAFLLIYLAAAFGLSRIPLNEEQKNGGEVSIYILSNGTHTDIVVPVKTAEMDWSQYIKFEDTAANDSTARLVALGWGDKGFYLETPTWDDLKASTAFNATFGLSTAAIHATFYSDLKEDNNCRRIDISKQEYKELITYIKNSFKTDPEGNSIWIETDANYGDFDAFYEAKGSYHLFHTCNTWTNNALKASNQKAALWTPFDTGIFYHYGK